MVKAMTTPAQRAKEIKNAMMGVEKEHAHPDPKDALIRAINKVEEDEEIFELQCEHGSKHANGLYFEQFEHWVGEETREDIINKDIQEAINWRSDVGRANRGISHEFALMHHFDGMEQWMRPNQLRDAKAEFTKDMEGRLPIMDHEPFPAKYYEIETEKPTEPEEPKKSIPYRVWNWRPFGNPENDL